MAVVVRLPAAGGRPNEKVHDAGEDVAVDDVGCLVVTSGDGKDEKTLAVYAPGVWISGEVQ